MKSFARIKSAGFSLLELLLVVAVGAVLILAGLGAYRLVSANTAASEGVRQLQTLKGSIQSAFQGQANYGTADLINILNNTGGLPSGMTYTNAGNSDTARNAFGGTTTAVGVTTTFTITFNNVSDAACQKMGTVFSSTSDPDFVDLTVNGRVTTAPTTAVLAGANFCGTAGNINTMIWEFR